MRRRALAIALSLFAASACGADPPVPAAPTTAAPAPPPRPSIQPVGPEDARAVVIQPESRRAGDEPGQVVLVGRAGWRKEAYLHPHPEGGSFVFETIQSIGTSRLVRRPNASVGLGLWKRRPMELLLSNGKLVPLGLGGPVLDATGNPLSGEPPQDSASAIDPYAFSARSKGDAIFEAATGREAGARARDGAIQEHSIPLPPVHGGTRLIEQVNVVSPSEGDVVRFSKLPSLAAGLSRKGRLAAVSGAFALVLAPARSSAVELVDLEGLAVKETIPLPRPLRNGASFAVSPDGKRIAAAVHGGLHVYDRAGKRWTSPKKEIKYPEDIVPPLSSVGFTADGKTICLRHVTSFFFPAARAPKGSIAHALFDSTRPGFHDGTCHVALLPATAGFEPLAHAAYGYQLQRIGSAISPSHDLGALLSVQKVADGSEDPREVELTIFELPSSKVRHRVPVGKWVPDYTADHLTVAFTAQGVSVYATTRGDNDTLGGVFDPVTGKRLSPMWVGASTPRTGLADILSRARHAKADPRWSKLKIDDKTLIAIDDQKSEHVLARGEPLPHGVLPFDGGPESGATLVDDDGHGVWIFANEGAGLLGTLIPAGKGVVALLDGGAVDLIGEVDEGLLGCLVGEDRLLPWAACKARVLVPGAAADARAGKVTWLSNR